MPARIILHPNDFSPESEHAFDVACLLAREQGARLVLLHVLPLCHTRIAMTPFDWTVSSGRANDPGSSNAPSIMPDGVRFSTTSGPLVMWQEAGPQECLERLDALRQRAGEQPVEVWLGEGYPVGKIIEVALETGCDLIVMGAGAGIPDGSMMAVGSVTEGVLKYAPCRVLAYRGVAVERDRKESSERSMEAAC